MSGSLKGGVIGAMLGAPVAGPFGAAGGGGLGMVLGFIDGDRDSESHRRMSHQIREESEKERQLGEEIKRETERQKEIELEIQGELRRQAELSAELGPAYASSGTNPSPASGAETATASAALEPILPPYGGSVPIGPTETLMRDTDGDGKVDIWTHFEDGQLVKEAFDTNEDDSPDRWAFFDPKGSHDLLRVEEDPTGDSKVDLWSYYEKGALARREADTDSDGRVDSWSYYSRGTRAKHADDSHADNAPDLLYHYRIGPVRDESHLPGLEETTRVSKEEQDRNFDGTIDVVLFFDDGPNLTRRYEDSNLNGLFDLWSYYESDQLVRVLKDTNGDGKPNHWSYYDPKNPGTLLREEDDLDFDGRADSVSHYENGELVRSEPHA
ncbi:MAG: hypothetical protein ACRD1Z_09800, partial [Vicinamibacteria bacterium]